MLVCRCWRFRTEQTEHTARGWTLKGSTPRYRRIDLNERGEEKQHFLLSAAACTLSPLEIARLTEAEAYDVYKAIRFSENGGEPFCPYREGEQDCGSTRVYELSVKRRGTPVYKCAVCRKQFTVTSGTTFASRKMSIRNILYAVAVFVNGVSGVAALRLRREVRCSYKTAFILEHKLREALMDGRESRLLAGEVEVDSISFDPHHRQANLEKDRKNKTGKDFNKDRTRLIVIARERGPQGESRMTVVSKSESHGAPFVLGVVDPAATLIRDQGNWPGFGRNKRLVVNHSKGLNIDGVHTNHVESVNSRIRRAARGVYYRIREQNLDLYGEEILWREDYRRLDNAEQWKRVLGAATHHPVSRRFKGYWQRHLASDAQHRRRRAVNPIAVTAQSTAGV